LVVAFGHFEMARTDLIGLARQGAETASVMPTASGASSAAELVGSSGVSGLDGLCQELSVQTDTRSFVPGGSVGVTIQCEVDLSKLGAPGLGGEHTIRIHQVAPIDPYRAVTP
jgi:hypothetical protein